MGAVVLVGLHGSMPPHQKLFAGSIPAYKAITVTAYKAITVTGNTKNTWKLTIFKKNRLRRAFWAVLLDKIHLEKLWWRAAASKFCPAGARNHTKNYSLDPFLPMPYNSDSWTASSSSVCVGQKHFPTKWPKLNFFWGMLKVEIFNLFQPMRHGLLQYKGAQY